MDLERRRHVRVDAVNLLTFNSYDDDDRLVEQGMGRTLNVSESGILLETTANLELENVVFVTIAFDEDLVDFKGKVVRSLEGPDNSFEMGIQFTELDERKFGFLREYIRMFEESQKEIPEDETEED